MATPEAERRGHTSVGGLSGASPIAHHPDDSEAQLSALHNEAESLKEEMARIRERRRQLESQRERLALTTSRASHRSASAGGGRPSSAMATPRPTTALCPPGQPCRPKPIASEEERRSHVPRTIYAEMKAAMRRSWQQDSTLVGGSFLQPESRRGTFGRAPRFTKPSEMPTKYYLSTEVEDMQRRARSASRDRAATMRTRGRPGCNVTSHWDDGKCGGAPGPGAYTPRYSAVSTPRGY